MDSFWNHDQEAQETMSRGAKEIIIPMNDYPSNLCCKFIWALFPHGVAKKTDMEFLSNMDHARQLSSSFSSLSEEVMKYNRGK